MPEAFSDCSIVHNSDKLGEKQRREHSSTQARCVATELSNGLLYEEMVKVQRNCGNSFHDLDGLAILSGCILRGVDHKVDGVLIHLQELHETQKS